jgi:hypothetical protein
MMEFDPNVDLTPAIALRSGVKSVTLALSGWVFRFRFAIDDWLIPEDESVVFNR